MAAAKKATKKPAAKPSQDDAPKKSAGTAMTQWDEELAKYAAASATAEANAGSGLQSFSLKAGVLSIDDNAMPNNEMAVIVLDAIFENVYYEEEYDPDNPSPPSAYALGRDEDELRWSEDSIPKYAGELCSESDINQWGSADKGRGKACRNLRRLLMIPAGTLDKRTGEFKMVTDEEHYAKVKPAFMKLPPTSTTNWSNYVKQLNGSLRKPSFVIATLVKVVPDTKSQFKVTFEALEEMPAELFEVLLRRHKEAEQLIMQPYDMSERDQPRERTSRRVAPARGAAKKGVAKKSSRKY